MITSTYNIAMGWRASSRLAWVYHWTFSSPDLIEQPRTRFYRAHLFITYLLITSLTRPCSLRISAPTLS